MWAALNSIVSNLPSRFYVNAITGSNKEELYEIISDDDNYSILIYTSVALHNRINRPVGKDAIRLVLRTFERLDDHIKVSKHERICRIYRTEGWEVRLHNRIFEAIEKENIDDMDFKPAEGVLLPIVGQETCFFCGDSEINGVTEDGHKVCAWHQCMVVGVDVGSKPDSSVMIQFRNGKMVAHSFLGRA